VYCTKTELVQLVSLYATIGKHSSQVTKFCNTVTGIGHIHSSSLSVTTQQPSKPFKVTVCPI
jgi:hypothetical protein